ncbi:MAG: DUF707 domain-containing protein [Sphingobacteriales bacterium]|nr:DUF707 domain-containing protein [Sphingobacteriales bacterium]OJW03985.1 MAG: hypothetical protein BGO52_17740 [Sphingobacteriales bacterium 44-61]
MQRNIVIAPVGNKGYLFKEKWLENIKEKEFELCLMFYHEQILDPSKYEVADHFFHLKDFKYHMLHELLTRVKPEWLEQYDYFYFLDDDIDINTEDINRMFVNARAMNADICQASLSRDSFCSWPIFKNHSNCFCRFVGQVEVMAPLFSKHALKACLESFIGNKSSWGVDTVWTKILGNPSNKLIVFDNVMMKHTLPVGGGELYAKLGVSPYDEWKMITDKYGSRKHYYAELGRLQLVDKKHSFVMYLSAQAKDKWRNMVRFINDFGFAARVKSRSRKLLGLK